MNHLNQRLIVQFVPHRWIGSHSVPSGAGEPVDVTERILQMPAEEVRALHDGNAASDNLVDPIDRGHWGPYRVCCEGAVCAFFAVHDVRQISQEMIDTKRSEIANSVPSDQADEKPRWLLQCGSAKHAFGCTAPDIEAAIAMCSSAHPGQPVISAMCVAA